MRETGRRYHPAGTPLRAPAGRRAARQVDSALTLRGGNLVRSLSPRQAVVWLMHLDQFAEQLPGSLSPELRLELRRRLARALRARVSRREGIRRRKRAS